MAVSIIVPKAPPAANTHIIYVRKGGSDTSGDGTLTNPYLTVTKAMNMVTGNISTFRTIIDVGAGNFSEGSSLVLKPYVYLVGNGISSSGPTRIVATNF